MKGKREFTLAEAAQIEKLIEQKLLTDSVTQRGLRNKIRKLGFYASDFGLRGSYRVLDFRSFVTIGGKTTKQEQKTEKLIPPKTFIPKTNNSKEKFRPAKQNDESYIIDLCDKVLNLKGSRQHRFTFLRGDTGVKLPVDVYYPSLNLVIEYYERQHSEAIPHFDKRFTASGITRGEQRKRYDERRRIELPKNGVNLIVFNYAEFKHISGKRLVRQKIEDLNIIGNKLKHLKK